MYSMVSIRHLDLDKGFLSVGTNESQQRHSVYCPNPVEIICLPILHKDCHFRHIVKYQ